MTDGVELFILGFVLVVAFIAILPKLFRDPCERMRQRDREYLWPEFRRHMMDRDHAIAAMLMHMAMNWHWHPADADDLDDPEFFAALTEQCLKETECWGPVGAHYYHLPAVLTPEQLQREGMLDDSYIHEGNIDLDAGSEQ